MQKKTFLEQFFFCFQIYNNFQILIAFNYISIIQLLNDNDKNEINNDPQTSLLLLSSTALLSS